MDVLAGNQLNGISQSSAGYAHGGTGTWPAVAQWGVGTGDVHQTRQSRSMLMGTGDQHKEMAEMFNLIDNAAPEFSDLSGMFNNYS